MVDLTAFKNIPYTLFTTGLFLTFTGLYIPIFGVVVNAQVNSHVGEEMSFYILSILNAASAFGRVIPGPLADIYGSLEIIVICTFCSAVFAYGWIGIHGLGGSIGFAIVHGFTSGAVVSIQASVVAALVPDVRVIGTWLGITLLVAGLGILIGSPIAGVLADPVTGSFSDALIFSGSFTFVGGVLFLVTWIWRRQG